MFGFFRHKKGVDHLKREVQDSFNQVKLDFGKVGKWITHIDNKHKIHDEELEELKNHVLMLQSDMNEIKDFISFFRPSLSKEVFKQPLPETNKQMTVNSVQTTVQTAVQTDILNNLTVMERAIVWSLLNSDMSLSYEDLAALLGKNKSTIRGQINMIKQKSDNLILEIKEPNGKKRLYIPEKIKESILKNVKIRVKSTKNRKSES